MIKKRSGCLGAFLWDEGEPYYPLGVLVYFKAIINPVGQDARDLSRKVAYDPCAFFIGNADLIVNEKITYFF